MARPSGCKIDPTYVFDIFHKSGKHHQDADSLSRAPHADPPIFHPDEEDILIAGASCRSEISLSETVIDETFLETLIREQKLDEELK